MSADRIWELIARKLAEEASDEELLELDLLLRSHPGIHVSIQTISDVWQQKSVADEEELAAYYEEHKERMEQKGVLIDLPTGNNSETTEYLLEGVQTINRKKYMWAAAAGIMLLLGAWGFFSWSKRSEIPVIANAGTNTSGEISTRYGSRTKMQLPDGTHVWLNAGSKISYNEEYGSSIREVSLTGEAYFDVVRNPAKPFIIHTATIDVKVLGTQFNVRSYPADKTTETSLIHGSVEIVVKKRPNEKFILKPNEKLVVLNEEMVDSVALKVQHRALPKDPLIAIRKLTYQQGDTSAIETAWTKDKLSFKDEPFSELAVKMERWYDVQFEFSNKRLEDVFITGSLQNETLLQALEALRFCTNTQFSYTIRNNKVIIF
jgi:transmembrane sensor